MTTIKEIIRQANADGYFDDNAEASIIFISRNLGA